MRLLKRLTTILREPLVHFLLIGALIFLADAVRGTPTDVAGRTITIAETDVGRLALAWERAWQRPPTPAELDGLIRDQIKEEIYYREALRLGLDKDDPVVRRRMRLKMEALAAAAAAADAETPTDDDLSAMLARNPARYAEEARFSFEQVFVGTRDPAPLLAELRAGRATSGVPISLPGRVEIAPRSDIGRQFGDDFAERLSKLPIGEWAGPVESGFGTHIVRVLKRVPPRPARFDNVRQRLANDWAAEVRGARQVAAYQTLLDGYDVKIKR